MNEQASDGEEKDPFTRAVQSFVETAEERFPPSPELSSLRDIMRMSSVGPFGNLLVNRDRVMDALSDFMLHAERCRVPKRDKSLLLSLFERINDYSAVADVVVECQAILELVYLDCSQIERNLFAEASRLRDRLFELPKEERFALSISSEFLSLVSAIIRQRRKRGFNVSDNLRACFDMMETVLENSKKQVTVQT